MAEQFYGNEVITEGGAGLGMESNPDYLRRLGSDLEYIRRLEALLVVEREKQAKAAEESSRG